MLRSKGVMLVSLILGIVLSLGIAMYAYNKLVAKSNLHTSITSNDDDQTSSIDLFMVDYEQYGNLKIGDNTLQCDIANNAGNTQMCTVFLKDEVGAITESSTLSPGTSCHLLQTTLGDTVPAKKEVTLVYQVLKGNNVSTIECPYTILVNEGVKEENEENIAR